MQKVEFKSEESGLSRKALLVRQAYVNQIRARQGKPHYGQYVMPAFDGGVSESGRKYSKSVWERIGDALDQRKFDVFEFMEYVFTVNSNIDTPAVVISNRNLDLYEKYISELKAPTIWELEENKIKAEITVKSSIYNSSQVGLEITLLNDNIDVSPLSRYAYGCRNNCEAMVKCLETAAYSQYLRRRFFYERFYKDKIPPEFLGKDK